MPLLVAGLVLFVGTTALATVISTLLFFGLIWPDGWSSYSRYVVWHAQAISTVTAPTCLLLVLAAWRGRRRPIVDGIALMAAIGFAVYGTRYQLAINSWSSGYAGLLWIAYVGGLLSEVPAYLITYFTLRRTPLLSALVPPRKTKGPAEASP